MRKNRDVWDTRAVRGTAMMLALAILVSALALILIGYDSWNTMAAPASFVSVGLVGIGVAAAFTISAWRATERGLMVRALFSLLIAYCALLAGPASQIYRGVNAWQNLAAVGEAIGKDAVGRNLVLFAPDETTRAFVDMYARTTVDLIPGPITADSTASLKSRLTEKPGSLVVTQLPGRSQSPRFREMAERLGTSRTARTQSPDAGEAPEWATHSQLRVAHVYALPNGRRYALLESR